MSQGWLTVSVFGSPVPGGLEYRGSLREEEWGLAVTVPGDQAWQTWDAAVCANATQVPPLARACTDATTSPAGAWWRRLPPAPSSSVGAPTGRGYGGSTGWYLSILILPCPRQATGSCTSRYVHLSQDLSDFLFL